MDTLETFFTEGKTPSIVFKTDEKDPGKISCQIQGFTSVDQLEDYLDKLLQSLATLSDISPDCLASGFAESSEVNEKKMIANTVIENPLPENDCPVSITVNIDPLPNGQARHQLYSTLPALISKKLLNAMHDRLMEQVK